MVVESYKTLVKESFNHLSLIDIKYLAQNI